MCAKMRCQTHLREAVHEKVYHGVDAASAVVMAKSIRRAQLLAFFASLPPCLAGSRHAVRGCGDTLLNPLLAGFGPRFAGQNRV